MATQYLRVLNVTDKDRWNCVFWVRARVPRLPYGLWTIGDKKKIINSQTSRVGAVAIISTGLPWGHVALVTDRSEGGKWKTIQEANYKFGKVTERKGTSKELKIVGYFDPKLA